MTIVSPAERRRRRSPDDAREAILASARRLLLAGGPPAITLKAVASALGMAHGNVTHHFGSAAGLQTALAEQMIDDLIKAVDDAVRRLRAGRSSRSAVIDLVFDAFEAGGAGRLIAWLASGDRPDRLMPLCGAVADLVQTLHSEDQSDDDDARIVSGILMALLPALGASLLGAPLQRALSVDLTTYRSIVAAQLDALTD